MTDLAKLELHVGELEARISKLENIVASMPSSEDAAWMGQLYTLAKDLVIKHRQASATFLQRKLLIDYPRAEKILIKLQADGIIGPVLDSEAREVLIQK